MTRTNTRSLGWAALAVTIVIFLAFAQFDSGHRILVATGLANEPKATTELYFDTQNAVPGSVEPGPPRPVSLSFYVGNLSTARRDVTWQVLTASPSGSRFLGEGVAAAISPRERRRVSLEIPLECSPEPFDIVVTIPGENVEIRRKIVCAPSPAGSSE